MNSIDKRHQEQLEASFEAKLDELLAAHEDTMQLALGGSSGQTGGALKQYQKVSPEAKKKLKGLLAYYAKKPHPFTACVRDNRKRFGPRAEAVCAVLKDIIRGTTRWRGHPNLDKGSAGLSEEGFIEMDEEVAYLIDCLSELDLWTLLSLAELPDDGLKFAYPMDVQDQPPPLTEKDHAFLDHMKAHHGKHLTTASKYLTGDPHPHVAGMAQDAVNESTRHLTRVNNMKKTGRPFGY